MKGRWFIVATATVLGSTSAFLSCRYYFRAFAQRMVATDKRFAALALTLKHDGLKLLVMIRLCPLPYSISNGAISTFPTVSPLMFMLSTAISTPKLLIHIFIGSRLRMLAEEGRKMDGKTRAINYGTIIGGVIIGVCTGLLIYRRTVARARQLEIEERAAMRAGRAANGYHDDSDDSAARVVDPRAARAAMMVEGLIEGDEMREAGLFEDTEEEDGDVGLWDDDAREMGEDLERGQIEERGLLGGRR